MLEVFESTLFELIVIDQWFLLIFEFASCPFGLTFQKGDSVLGLFSLILDLFASLFVVIVEGVWDDAGGVFGVGQLFSMHLLNLLPASYSEQ